MKEAYTKLKTMEESKNKSEYFILGASLKNKKLKILVDTGAGKNFINENVVKELNLNTLNTAPINIQFSNKKMMRINKQVKMKINLDNFPKQMYSITAYILRCWEILSHKFYYKIYFIIKFVGQDFIK